MRCSNLREFRFTHLIRFRFVMIAMVHLEPTQEQTKCIQIPIHHPGLAILKNLKRENTKSLALRKVRSRRKKAKNLKLA